MSHEPRRHVRRTPLPWRESDRTECGRPVADFVTVRTFDEAKAEYDEMGQVRFALVYCMTCASVAGRWPRWETDPVTRLVREDKIRGDETESLIARELWAMSALVAAHPDEFAALVEGLGKVDHLADKRAERRYRASR